MRWGWSNTPKPTIASLRLNLEEAEKGRVWLLLPEGFRDQDAGKAYPLPWHAKELQKLVAIPTPSNNTTTGGAIYLRRALKRWKERVAKRQSTMLTAAATEHRIEQAKQNFDTRVKSLRAEISSARDDVIREAERAIANLNDLFVLGRRGIEGQMRAHLEGAKWQGEEITAKAFRDCFRMVTQAVKGLGLPSDQQRKAVETVHEELAASLRAMKETLAMAPGTEGPEETKH